MPSSQDQLKIFGSISNLRKGSQKLTTNPMMNMKPDMLRIYWKR